MRAWKSSTLSNTTARPRCRSRCGDAAAGLMTAPSGRGCRAARRCRPSACSGPVAGPDHLGVPDRRVVQVVDQRPAGHRERVRVEQVADLAQHRQQPAGPVEVLHQEPAGRLQVDQQRHPGADPVEVVQGQRRSRAGRRWPAGGRPRWSTRRSRPAPRSRCGTTRGQEGARAAGPAATSSTASRPVSCAASSSRLSGAGVPATPGHDRARAPRRPGHRRRGAHRVAVAAAADHRRLRRGGSCLRRQRARPDLLGQPPHVGAAAERHAAERAGEHRPARHDHGRQVDRRGGHQQRRDRLVAAAEQHHAVDRVGPQHLLGGHRGHVAPQHRGRPDLRLAQRHHRQVQRHAAGLPHAAGGRLGHLVQVALHGVRSDAVLAIRSAAGRRTRARAARGASRPGGCRRSGRSRRTTARCAGSPPGQGSGSPRRRIRWSSS